MSAPPGILFDGNCLVGQIPPYTQTSGFSGGKSDPANQFSAVEMDGNRASSVPILGYNTTPRYNDRPGKSISIKMKGKNTTKTIATKRAQFRVNPAKYPYITPTNNGDDNDLWFGFAFHLGAGYEKDLSTLSGSKWHNIFGPRHFTSTHPTFYCTLENMKMVMRRSAQPAGGSGWPDGKGSDKMSFGTLKLGWNTLIVHAKFSRTTNNALREGWCNGTHSAVKTTANCYGTSQMRVRVGVYQDTGFLNDHTFTVANFRIGRNREAVNPDNPE